MEKFLPDVVANTLGMKEVELVVADNGSSDGSLAFLRSSFSDSVRCLELGYNYGFAEGYNRALAQLDAAYVVLLNSDVAVTPGWLNDLIEYMDAHSDVAVCQPKIRSIREDGFFEHAGACGGFLDVLGYPFCRGRVLSYVEEDRGQYDVPIDLFWATGACFCVRLDDYRAVGGLDAGFFAHMEEIDLCWRLRSRGRRVVCLPKSCVYHLGGATLNRENPRKTFLNYRNNLLMLYKNYESRRFVFVFVVRFFLDYLSVLIFLFSGKFRDARAVVHARWAFWKMRPLYKAQRLENLHNSQKTMIPEMYRGSMVFDYYFLGKRRFSDYFPW